MHGITDNFSVIWQNLLYKYSIWATFSVNLLLLGYPCATFGDSDLATLPLRDFLGSV